MMVWIIRDNGAEQRTPWSVGLTSEDEVLS